MRTGRGWPGERCVHTLAPRWMCWTQVDGGHKKTSSEEGESMLSVGILDETYSRERSHWSPSKGWLHLFKQHTGRSWNWKVLEAARTRCSFIDSLHSTRSAGTQMSSYTCFHGGTGEGPLNLFQYNSMKTIEKMHSWSSQVCQGPWKNEYYSLLCWMNPPQKYKWSPPLEQQVICLRKSGYHAFSLQRGSLCYKIKQMYSFRKNKKKENTLVQVSRRDLTITEDDNKKTWLYIRYSYKYCVYTKTTPMGNLMFVSSK